jgi:hypothetical protein
MPLLYVPILKGKEGEYGALEALSASVQNVIAPLIEVPDVPYDYANERPARSLDDHVGGVADRLKRSWGDRHLYLELPWFGDDEHLRDGMAAAERVFNDCAARQLNAVPVVRTSSSDAYLAATRSHVRRCGGRFAIRLMTSDFDEEGAEDPLAQVTRLLNSIQGIVAQGDLILDFGDVGEDAARASLVARSVLSQAPLMEQWQRVVLAGASFPENLSEFSAATTSKVPRIEWQVWQRLRRRPLPRNSELVFGDYAIAHPIPSELDPRVMRMSASIRYTTEEHWLVVKGKNVREWGFDQYYDLARNLVALPEFSGEHFSWGDQYIARAARAHVTGPGNATTWRKVGTNHHITFVATDLMTTDPAV